MRRNLYKFFYLLPVVPFIFSCSATHQPEAFLPAKEVVLLNQLIYKDSIGHWLIKTAPNYELVWEPEAVKGNFAVVFKNKKTEQYCIVVRGSLLEMSNGALQNWIQDFNIFQLKNWQYTDTVQKAAISGGSYEGFQNLLRLQDKIRKDSLVGFLQKLPAFASVILSGHSLGGNLAQVLASYLWKQSDKKRRKQLNVISFGATAIGNNFFVQDLEEKFPLGERYEIDKDIAPKFPNVNEVSAITGIMGLDSIFRISGSGSENRLLSKGLELLGTITKELNWIPKENNYAQSKTHLRLLPTVQDTVADNSENVISSMANQIYRYHKIDRYAGYFGVKPLESEQ